MTTPKLSRSPDRNSFQRRGYLDRMAAEGRTPENDDHVSRMVEYYNSWNQRDSELEADPDWHRHNLESDLRSTDWILAKVRASEAYAQNLYAAMCNREFQHRDVWALLKDQTWSCSWRYAGGIVADMRQEGDYIDWYCSGIRGGASEEDLANMTVEERAQYNWYQENFVSESVVTDEIREDLARLGWIVMEDGEEDQ